MELAACLTRMEMLPQPRRTVHFELGNYSVAQRKANRIAAGSFSVELM